MPSIFIFRRGEVISADLIAVQIAVRDEDFCVGVINTLDDGGNRIVQLCADQVAALAGENFKSRRPPWGAPSTSP